MIKLAPFSDNQKKYMSRVKDSWFNVLEGGVRGGKNITHAQVWGNIIDWHPSKLHLAGAFSIANTLTNIFDSDGLGLRYYFKGRCRDCLYENKTALEVETPTGTKCIIASGGGTSRDFRSILGNTYGTAYITEANECDLRYLETVFDRTLSSPDRKIFHDFNPKGESHPYYTEILDYHEEMQLKHSDYGYNYGHVTIADNISMTQKQVDLAVLSHDPTSVWFVRDILGQRKQAEGAIYTVFTENKDKIIKDFYIGDTIKDNRKLRTGFITIGVDVGGSKAGHALTASFVDHQYKYIHILETERHISETDPEQFIDLVVDFIDRITDKYKLPKIVYFESAEQILLRGLRNRLRNNGINLPVRNSIKTQINERIKLTVSLLAQDRLYLTNSCKNLEQALDDALWDSKNKGEDKRLDDGTSDIDSLDSFEYSFEAYAKGLIDYKGVG